MIEVLLTGRYVIINQSVHRNNVSGWLVGWLTVFNATFNISAISWLSVLLVEETGENLRPVASH
jgi:hypothetical protein